MSTLSSDRKPPVDYGVQIRFIKDLHDNGGVYADKSKGHSSATTPTNKYGVAVRVQGISGHPYVVLKDGEKGDSYGVQLNTPTSSSGPPSPKIVKEPTEITNPYSTVVNATRSPVSAAEDEEGEIFGSPLKRPPGDGQAGTQGEDDAEPAKERKAERAKAEPQVKAAARKKEMSKDWAHEEEEEYNEAGLKPVKLNDVEPRGVKPPGSGFTASLGRYSEKKQSKSTPVPSESPASTNEEPLPEVDTNSLAPINKLISKFNSGTPGGPQQVRGRSGARQRLKFEERRRSRSLDARKDPKPDVSLPSPSSPAVNPYTAPLSASSSLSTSPAPAGGSLGRSPPTVFKVTTLETSKPSLKSSGRLVEKDAAQVVAKKPVSTSDGDAGRYLQVLKCFATCLPHSFVVLFLKEITPRTLTHSTGSVDAEEAEVKQALFNILKNG